MRLLVTGGAGFIGSNFIHYWLKNHPEDEVVNFDLLTYAGNPANLEKIVNLSNYKFIKGDIRNKEDAAKAMLGIDVVVHFAAETHVDRSISEPEVFVTTNVLGTQVLVNEALKTGVKRFHHISTDEVFGSLPLEGNEAFSENTPHSPRNPYSASKAGAESLVRAYYETYGLPITITNCGNNYGPYHFPEKYIPNLITRALTGKKLPVYGHGVNIRDWIFVEDHCRAIEAVISKGRVGETYLVGDQPRVSNLDIARKICELTGISEDRIEFVSDRPGHDLRYSINSTKIKTELGWTPTRTLEQGLRETIDWYKNNEQWWRALLERAKIKTNGHAVKSYNWGLPQDESSAAPEKRKTVLIFGRGQLGTFYKDYYLAKSFRVVQAVRPEVDVRNYADVLQAVKDVKPDFVINAAAMTNIDWCEQNKEEAFAINTLGADNIGRACQETGTYLLHISSGCVQESKTAEDAKSETDPVAPLCYYSWTKVWAENLLLDRMNRHGLWVLVLRPRQLISAMVSPRNALTKMLTYNKFINTPNSCTIVEDYLEASHKLVERNKVGVYNIVNPDVTTPYQIAVLLKEIIKPEMQFEKISKDELNRMTFAKRVDAVLTTAKLESEGIALPPIHTRLPEIISQLKTNLEKPEADAVMAKTTAETATKLSLVNR